MSQMLSLGKLDHAAVGTAHDEDAIGRRQLAADPSAMQVVIGLSTPFSRRRELGRLDAAGYLLGVDALQAEVIDFEPSVTVIRGARTVGLEVAGTNAEFEALAFFERHHDSHLAERHLA